MLDWKISLREKTDLNTTNGRAENLESAVNTRWVWKRSSRLGTSCGALERVEQVLEQVRLGARGVRRTAEQVALPEITAQHRQLGLLGRRLDAFGGHAQLERLSQGD